MRLGDQIGLIEAVKKEFLEKRGRWEASEIEERNRRVDARRRELKMGAAPIQVIGHQGKFTALGGTGIFGHNMTSNKSGDRVRRYWDAVDALKGHR
jgi:hypothetical protein